MAEETKNIVKIERGDVIFHKGEKITRIALLVKGSVMVIDKYMQIPLQVGDIIGLMDMGSDEYLFDYVALDTSMVCMFEFKNIDDYAIVGTAIKDYRNYIIRSVCNQMDNILNVYETLDDIAYRLYKNIKEYNEKYKKLCSDYGKTPALSSDIEKLQLYNDDDKVNEKTVRYFQSLSELPVNTVKAFVGEDDDITGYHVYVATELSKKTADACKIRYKFCIDNFELMFSKGADNIFTIYSKLAIEVLGEGGDISNIMKELDAIVEFIHEYKEIKEETLGLEFGIDFSKINEIYKVIQMKQKQEGGTLEQQENNETEQNSSGFTETQVNEAIEATSGSLKKILAYSGISSEKAESFEKYLASYKALKDPFSTENDVRKLRSRITELYYEIYENVFFNAEEEKSNDRIISMFLDYGYMDEDMFDKDCLVELYFKRRTKYQGKLSVYTIRQWLQAIYSGEKEPSKNEFDLDYEENFRELKKTQKFTPEEERNYFSDKRAKVHYEIVNMFKSNNRITNGQITTFCPVLCGRDFMMDMSKMYISGKKVEDAILEITAIDFSAFYREYLYEDMEHKISRLNLYKEVLPDVILMPNVGHNGSMWQEISGKKRDTPGRFVLPSFTVENFQDIVIKLVGAFRWELCRTIQGTYWNDIREKSLTAEYCDYVQFYRKNRELSDEAKEKVKVQMQKSRNSTREMFTKDYELWIKNEALGLARLNKVVRMILFTYCPFAKEYRSKIAEHPMFKECAARYERERLKKVKELNNRFAAIRNVGGEITPLLEQNMDYLQQQ